MIYSFQGYTLDIARHELRRGAEQIAVEPQVFDLLLYLIRNRGGVVSKDDLIAGLWNGRAISDSALSSRITAARRQRRSAVSPAPSGRS
jgi:DNA-binding winged helix-turn-helix (wHTH) protein